MYIYIYIYISSTKGQYSHEVFHLGNHQSIINNICAKFHKKTNSSQEIYHKAGQKYPKSQIGIWDGHIPK